MQCITQIEKDSEVTIFPILLISLSLMGHEMNGLARGIYVGNPNNVRKIDEIVSHLCRRFPDNRIGQLHDAVLDSLVQLSHGAEAAGIVACARLDEIIHEAVLFQKL